MSDNMMEERKEIQCHDCGAKEGQLHTLGCDMERCPFCGHQLISCDCIYEKLKLFDREKYTNETYFLPPEIYSEGVNEEQWQQWKKMLDEKGRYPYFQYPILCALCGEHWPQFFRVPDAEWKRYIAPNRRHDILCRDCYDYIVEATNWQAALAYVDQQIAGGAEVEPYDYTLPAVWATALNIPVTTVYKAIATRKRWGEHHG